MSTICQPSETRGLAAPRLARRAISLTPVTRVGPGRLIRRRLTLAELDSATETPAAASPYGAARFTPDEHLAITRQLLSP